MQRWGWVQGVVITLPSFCNCRYLQIQERKVRAREISPSSLGPIPSSWGANSLLPPPTTSAHCSQSHLYKVITRFTGQLTPQHTLWLTLAPEGTPRPPNPQGPRPPALWVMAPKPAPASSRQAPPAALMCLDLSILCLPHTSVLLLFSLKTLVFWPHCVTCGTSVP